ncbi:MAG: nitroreductase/quinone reductase family protein [Anaerolineales bacterium]
MRQPPLAIRAIDRACDRKADPAATVEIEGRQFEAIPRDVQCEERERLCAHVIAADLHYAEHQSRTERVVPEIVSETQNIPDDGRSDEGRVING